MADPAPTDPLAGLEGAETVPLKGHGARTKQPSAYTHQILTGKGFTTRVAEDRTLPRGVPGASVAEVASQLTNTPLHAMLASIPAGAEPKNEAEARGSPGWPHWEKAMAKEVSKLTAKHTWELVDALPGMNIGEQVDLPSQAQHKW